MRVVASNRFLRRARKLKPPRDELLRAALRRFAADPQDPLLRTHKLKGDLADYHLAHSARADLHRRLGQTEEARAAYRRALDLARQEPERRFLERRLRELGD